MESPTELTGVFALNTKLIAFTYKKHNAYGMDKMSLVSNFIVILK